MAGKWLRSQIAPAILLALSLAVLTGCSTVRIGYTQLDNIALWTADRYFDLDEQQKKEFSMRVRRLHVWHRNEQLPDYAEFLTLAKARVERGLNAKDVHWFLEGIKKRYEIIVNRGADDAAAILLTITPHQLDFVQERWEKLNRRFVSDNRLDSSVEEQRQASSQRSISRFRDWFGSLSIDQERIIRASVEKIDMTGSLRHQDRMRRQREFLQLMQLRGEPGVFKEKLRHWLIHWDAGRSPEYQRAWARWRDQNIAMLLAVDRTLTSQQRAMAVHRLQDYIDDFRALAERSGVRAATVQKKPPMDAEYAKKNKTPLTVHRSPFTEADEPRRDGEKQNQY